MREGAGVTVWLGVMGTGAIVENGKVTGVEVATPSRARHHQLRLRLRG